MTENNTIFPQAIKKTIFINAAPSKLWEALTVPVLMNQWMAETLISIVTDWKVGHPMIIQGNLHEINFTNTGSVLQFEPERVLAYSHLSSISDLPDNPENYSVITFNLIPQVNQVELILTLNNFPTEVIFRHLEFYWNGTLGLLKKFVEG